jgi:hypothetical protein
LTTLILTAINCAFFSSAMKIERKPKFAHYDFSPTPQLLRKSSFAGHSTIYPTLVFDTILWHRKVKGKGFPLQAWCGSWCSTRLRLLDLLDFRHYEGGKVVTLTHRPPSHPGVFLVLIFRGWVDPRAHGSVGSFGKNSQRHHRGSILKPFE